MTMENSRIISDGFAILRDTLAPYIGRELGLEFGSNIWWREGVMKTLRDEQKRNLPTEGYEVVRRRLFLDCKNPDERDSVCTTFSQMYNENQSDFPTEVREIEYMERMVSCYPIHPEIFDRLYEDWATLERFQRTRGVLRLMAAVIHELWMGNDAGLMIMPGSIPLDVPNVRDELTRHLSEGWNALVDREVDGRNSVPFQKDQSTSRYGGKLASRRVARTVMLGSAPTVRDQTVRGIEASRIRLGVVQPG
jgi:predicted AAA+ superfamily ATPase